MLLLYRTLITRFTTCPKVCYLFPDQHYTTHLQANGFLGAGGFAGAIPAAYTHLARLFFGRVRAGGHEQRLSLHEYRRQGWTFHAKGLWYTRPGHLLPSLTMVGSPNFGECEEVAILSGPASCFAGILLFFEPPASGGNSIRFCPLLVVVVLCMGGVGDQKTYLFRTSRMAFQGRSSNVHLKTCSQ